MFVNVCGRNPSSILHGDSCVGGIHRRCCDRSRKRAIAIFTTISTPLTNNVSSKHIYKSKSVSQSKGKHSWHQKHNTLKEAAVIRKYFQTYILQCVSMCIQKDIIIKSKSYWRRISWSNNFWIYKPKSRETFRTYTLQGDPSQISQQHLNQPIENTHTKSKSKSYRCI